MRKPLSMILIFLFCFSAFLTPVGVISSSTITQEPEASVTRMNNAPVLSELQNPRVAIYTEPNSTDPSYATNPGTVHNNATGLRDILLRVGYEATLLDVVDISNDMLTTANFDAIVLPDNLPRENITMKIKTFWMNGGGILSIDGSSGYLCYFGILPPEALGTSGYNDYWTFSAQNVNITTMHPISQDFTVDQVIPTAFGFLDWNWTALQQTSIANELTRIGRSNSYSDSASILAYNPSGGEGRIVTIPNDFVYEYVPAIDNMIPDAVLWLSQSDTIEFEGRTTRVAIYDESNTTMPDYGFGQPPGLLQYTAPDVANMLTSYGYQVTLLSMEDILNHQLLTGDFDVFVMADSLPWSNISTMIREYWMGGGSLFAMDSSIMFLLNYEILGYGGGNYGYGTFFNYDGSDITISTRHPVTKAYQPGETLDVYWDDYAAWNWTELQELSYASDLTRLAYSENDVNITTSLAYDPSDGRGGKVVTLSYSFVHALPEIHQMMADAMDWLCPRPKGRVLFDVSHYSYYGVDTWDNTGYIGNRYSAFREDLVRSCYTFDKYYGGNFTYENLAPYDMLIINTPETVFVGGEVVAVTNWVASGGGLLALGDWNAFSQENDNLNYLMSNYNLSISTDQYTTFQFTSSDFEPHLTIEGIGSLFFSGGNYLNYTGTTEPIVWDGPNLVVAGQEFGIGRIMLVSDINFFADYIDNNDNHQFAINTANWLTSGDAEVLVYADTAYDDPNSNTYRGPVAQALNDLGIPFQLTSNPSYFAMSLFEKDWKLVVVDNINAGISSYFDEIFDYLKNGGKMVLSTWLYFSSFGTPMFNYIGFEYQGPTISPPPEIFLWPSEYILLTSYSGDTISTTADFGFSTECAALSVFDNATALAGLSPTPHPDNATVILGAGGNVIVNGMLTTMYTNDTDDSTYRDSYEIWRDEIGYLLFDPTLTIDNPIDVEYEYGDTGNEIVWSPTSNDPGFYVVMQDGSELISGDWDGSPIPVDVDGLDLGVHSYTLTVSHSLGYMRSDTVEVLVADTTAPVFDIVPFDLLYTVGATGNNLVWSATELLPDSYELWIDGSLDSTQVWNGSDIAINVDGLAVGVHNYTIVLIDQSSNTASDTVIITVNEEITTSTTTTTSTVPTGGVDNTLLLLIIIGVGAAVVIIIIIIVVKKKQT